MLFVSGRISGSPQKCEYTQFYNWSAHFLQKLWPQQLVCTGLFNSSRQNRHSKLLGRVKPELITLLAWLTIPFRISYNSYLLFLIYFQAITHYSYISLENFSASVMMMPTVHIVADKLFLIIRLTLSETLLNSYWEAALLLSYSSSI